MINILNLLESWHVQMLGGRVQIARFASVLFAVWVALGASARAQNATVNQVAKAMARQRESVRSLFVSYKSKCIFDDLALKAGLARGITTEEITTFAFKESKRFCQVRGSYIGAKQEKVPDERLAVYDGAQCTVVEPKVVYIQRDKSGFTESCTYLTDMGWVYPDSQFKRAADTRRKYQLGTLPECLDHPDWQVRARRTEIKGLSCVVLYNRTLGDKLFLDPERDYTLLRRERTKSYSANISSEVREYSDFIRVTPELWLPKHKVTTLTYDNGGTQTHTWDVTTVSANHVADSLFEVKTFRPGSMIYDSIHKMIYQYDEGNDVLETSVARAAFLHRVSTRLPRRIVIPVVIFNIVLVGGTLLLYWIKRRREKQDGSSAAPASIGTGLKR